MLWTDKAKKILQTFPYALEKAILFLITLTKRSNIKDLVDEVFSFTKDRYFIGESVLVTFNQGNNKNDSPKQCKIIDVILPSEYHSSNNDEVKNNSISSTLKQNGEKNGLLIDTSKIKYIVELTSSNQIQPTRQNINASQVVRIKNALTKDKLYMITKLNCEVNSQTIWALTDYSMNKHKLNQIKFTDIFKGDQPKFEQSYGRGQFSKSNTQGKHNESSNMSSPKKKNNSSFTSNNQRKTLPESNKSNKLKSSQSASNINKASSNKNQNSSLNSSINSKKSKSNTSQKEQNSNKKLKSPSSNKVKQNKINESNEDLELDENVKFAQRVVQVLAKKGNNIS
jgi:bromodomain adjacent to zinc finger domain protein 1A